jgi:hypothetical protein
VDLQIAGGVTGVRAGNFVGGAKGGAARVALLNAAGSTDVARGTAAVTFYASADDAIDSSDAVLATVNKRLKLKPGKAVAVKARFNYPAGVPDGNYFILARADSANAFGETDETNNDASSATPVGIAAPFVDLAASDVRAGPPPVAVGTKPAKQKASVRVTNHGNVASNANVVTRFAASADATLDAGDVILGEVARPLRIAPGKAMTVSVPIEFPPGLVPGSYVVLVRVDAADAIAEKDEGDNTAIASVLLGA